MLTKKLGFAVVLGCLTLPVLAETASSTVEDNWSGTQVSFGYIGNTGSSDVNTLNASLEVNYTKNKWFNSTTANILYGESDGAQNQQSYAFADKLHHNISDSDNSAYVGFSWSEDYFGAYKSQYIASLGFQRKWINNDTWTLSTSAGPAYTYSVPQGKLDPDFTKGNVNGDGALNVSWQVSEGNMLKEAVQYIYGSPAHQLISTTSFTSSVSTKLSAIFSYQITSYSSYDSSLADNYVTTTTTSVSLAYIF